MVTEGGTHLDLREHIASPAKKQPYVNRLFATIAGRYDFITRFLSYGMDRRWKRRLVELACLRGGELVLDLACGTGDITFALAERLPGGQAVGLDITPEMIRIAEQKRRSGHSRRASFGQGDIMRLPFAAGTFDCVTGGYALRNVPDLGGALAEIHRVLKPGGRLLSLDFGKPRWALYRWLYLRYLAAVGAALGLVLHRDPDAYRYIPESLKLYPGQYELLGLMRQSGYVDQGHQDFLGGIMAINWARKPEAVEGRRQTAGGEQKE